MALRILLVDDEPDLLELYSELLAEEGFSVESVNSSHLAISKLSSSQFDLVLSDFTMPCGGLKKLGQLCQSQGVKLPPLVLISGHAQSETCPLMGYCSL